MSDSLEKLKQTIFSIQPLNESDWQKFSEIWKPFSAKRKEILTISGEKEKYLYFVLEGVQRVYFLDDQNREATLVFTYLPSFGGVLDAFMLQQKSNYYYETLTPSSFLRISFADLEPLLKQNAAIEYIIRQGITQAFSGLLTRLTELQCFSADERFLRLLQRSPHILQLVPHKYLANYLGIDATNFSKLINKIRI